MSEKNVPMEIEVRTHEFTTFCDDFRERVLAFEKSVNDGAFKSDHSGLSIQKARAEFHKELRDKLVEMMGVFKPDDLRHIFTRNVLEHIGENIRDVYGFFWYKSAEFAPNLYRKK
jgi:hypothetical protein